MKPRILPCAALVLLPVLVSAQRIAPAKVIKNIESALEKAGSLQIDFKETYVWSFTGVEQSSEGRLLLEGEDKFRVESGGQVMVSDGKTLWSYSAPDKRVIIDWMENNEETMLPRRMLFHYSRDYDLRVDGEETVNGAGCLKLLFTTQSGETMFPEVTVWVNKDSWMIVQVRQTDLNGNETEYLLETVKTNMTFDPDLFTFTVPEGSEVVDMRGMKNR